METPCRFAQLQAVDVEGVPPALRADLSDENVTRPDEVVQYTDRHAPSLTRIETYQLV